MWVEENGDPANPHRSVQEAFVLRNASETSVWGKENNILFCNVGEREREGEDSRGHILPTPSYDALFSTDSCSSVDDGGLMGAGLG